MAEDLTYFVFRRRIISNYSSVMLPFGFEFLMRSFLKQSNRIELRDLHGIQPRSLRVESCDKKWGSCIKNLTRNKKCKAWHIGESGNSSSKLVGFTANGIKTSYKQLWGTLVNFNQRHFFVIFLKFMP